MYTDQEINRTMWDRLTEKQKNANDKQWYKDWANRLNGRHYKIGFGYGGIPEFKRMKTNYDLFNNKIDMDDLAYVCKPFGIQEGAFPARLENRDIVSSLIKSVLGMEQAQPFNYKVFATNKEATTRKEQKAFELYKEYTTMEIMTPIIEAIQKQLEEEIKGRELSEEETAQIQQQVQEMIKAMTPDEIKLYMERKHQDPAEILGKQILEYLRYKESIKEKTDLAFKHGLLSGSEVCLVTILNSQPVLMNVNSMRFNCEKSPDTFLIEEAETASCEYRLLPSQVLRMFGDQLTTAQIDRIYEKNKSTGSSILRHWLDSDSTMVNHDMYDIDDVVSTRVLHCVWKSLRKIGFLTYQDETGEQQMSLVGEDYKMDESAGDLYIEWDWVPETYECWKIEEDIYVNMRPVPGQIRDINNAYECKLPYYGVIYENLNSERVALMDRVKSYQYLYNIIWYRLDLILASDEGKKVLLNINNIPESKNIDLKKWMHYFKTTPFMFFDPNEEGANYQDANTAAKVIDLSLASDIEKYMQILQFIRTECMRSIGINEQLLGQIAERDAVRNVKTSIQQTSYILMPYFKLHATFKKNILMALIECAKVAYSMFPERNISIPYVLDDLSSNILKIDTELLNESTYGIFVEDAANSNEIKGVLEQLAQAALQNQAIELSDIIKILNTESITESEEILKVAEKNRIEREEARIAQQQQHEQQMQQMQMQMRQEQMQFELQSIITKEEERRKTEIIKSSLMGASFNPDLDKDKDGLNDFMEIALKEDALKIKEEELRVKQQKMDNDYEIAQKKIALENRKVNVQALKQ